MFYFERNLCVVLFCFSARILFVFWSQSANQDLIVISGYERNVEEARQAIQQLVAELQEMVSQDIHLDPRTHARIIGARGKAIRKLMEEFKVRRCDVSREKERTRRSEPPLMVTLFVQVDIRFPQPGSDQPDRVTVTGLPETISSAVDHLLNLEEEYVSSAWSSSDLLSVCKV